MKVTEIPFNKFIGITESAAAENHLRLAFSQHLTNHLGTFHAGAQFALAEACSGKFLQNQFPELQTLVVPVVRKADIKFKRPAQNSLLACASVEPAELDSFKQQFDKKGRATIAVSVEVQDESGNITMTGRYEWYVQNTKETTRPGA